MLRTLLLTLCTLSLVAQDAPKPAAKPASVPAAKIEAAPKGVKAPAPKAKPADKIIARVGDHFVYQSEVDASISALPPQQQQQMMMVQGARDQYVKSFIEMQLLAVKARKEGFDKTDSYKRKADVALAQVLATEVLAKEGPALQAKMQIKDEDVKAYYEANKAKFMSPEKFDARHILIGIKSDKMPAGVPEEEAKAKLAKVEQALKEGKKLEDLTKEYSDDPGSKDKGGLYENIAYGSFMPEFEKAVRDQEIGKVGGVVRTPYGFHLIQVVKRTTAEQESFEAAKDKARTAVTKERQEQVWTAFLDKIKKDVHYQVGGEINPSTHPAAKVVKKAAK